jgi:hypothetical protein
MRYVEARADPALGISGTLRSDRVHRTRRAGSGLPTPHSAAPERPINEASNRRPRNNLPGW